MSNFSEQQLETAEHLVTAGRDAAVARIRAELDGDGAEDCADCGEPIPQARRAALPSAERCVGCQARAERRSR